METLQPRWQCEKQSGSAERIDRKDREPQTDKRGAEKRQMREINGMRDRVAPEIGSKITVQNGKL